MIDYNLRQEKMDAMRQDMLIEIKLRNDDDYFYDHMYDLYGSLLDDLRIQIINECECYGRDGDDWFELMSQN